MINFTQALIALLATFKKSVPDGTPQLWKINHLQLIILRRCNCGMTIKQVKFCKLKITF